MKDEFYSQFGEDKWLIEQGIINPGQKGVFLDIGAGHYQKGSNTYYLEQKGWEGLCVDADPRTYNLLLMNRNKCLFGIASDHYALETYYLSMESSDISRTKPQVNSYQVVLPSFPVKDIIDTFQLRAIDLLSVDVEGDELKVLTSLFDHTPILYPRIIIVEYLSLQDNHLPETRAFFDKLPYKLIHQTEANLLYQYV